MGFLASDQLISLLFLSVFFLSLGTSGFPLAPDAASRNERVAEPTTNATRAQPTAVPGRAVQPQKAEAAPVRISGVVVSPASFRASAGQGVTIGYRLTAAAGVTVSIYGPNWELVRRFPPDSTLPAGNHQQVWDGRDSNGEFIRDEAYFFVIDARTASADEGNNAKDNAAKGGAVKTESVNKETQLVARYDPLESSGGELVNPQEFHARPHDNSVEYVLPRPCRVRIRAGVDDGPMLNTLVNWEPRVRGLCTDVWRGKDSQGVRHFSTRPDCFLTSMAFALPENSIIAYGNKSETYREWYLREGLKRPKKPHVPRSLDKPGVMCRHWYFPPHLAADPEIVVSFPQLKGYEQSALKKAADGTVQPAVIADNVVLVRVSMPNDAHRKFLLERQFEMVIFVDDRRLFEAEQSAVPFNFRWDVSMLSSGSHHLTINVVSAADHVGTFTAPIVLKRSTEPPGDENRPDDAKKPTP